MKKFNKIIIFILVIYLISGCSNKREELNPDSINYCENIKNKELQEQCFIDYAKKIATIKEDEALIACRAIDDSILKDICLFEVFKKVPQSKKIELCEEIKDPSLRFKCLRITDRPHLARLID